MTLADVPLGAAAPVDDPARGAIVIAGRLLESPDSR
jgi:hypothetical protein